MPWNLAANHIGAACGQAPRSWPRTPRSWARLARMPRLMTSLPLGGRRGIASRPGAQAVAKGKNNIIGQADIKQPVKIFRKRIFAVVFSIQRASIEPPRETTAHGAGVLYRKLGPGGAKGRNARVTKINALFRLFGDFVKSSSGRISAMSRPLSIRCWPTEYMGTVPRDASIARHLTADGIQIAGNPKDPMIVSAPARLAASILRFPSRCSWKAETCQDWR